MLSTIAFRFRLLAIPMAALLLHASSGCGSSAPTMASFEKYDELPYAETFDFVATKDQAHRAAVAALQRRGAVITVSDPQTGLLNAQLHSADVIAEERYEPKGESDGGSGILGVLAAIVGVILFILLLGWASDGCSDTSSTRTRTRDEDRDTHLPHYDTPPPPPEPMTAFSYIFSCTFTPVTDTTTNIRFNVIRQTVQNGTVTGSARVENKYVNYSLRDAVTDELEGR